MSKFFKVKKAGNSEFLLDNAYDALMVILKSGYLSDIDIIVNDVDLYLSYKNIYQNAQITEDIDILQNKLNYLNSTDPQTDFLKRMKAETIQEVENCIEFLKQNSK